MLGVKTKLREACGDPTEQPPQRGAGGLTFGLVAAGHLVAECSTYRHAQHHTAIEGGAQ